MANAAAVVQQDDDSEPPDAEPWVLEGWGDGPSVSEAAQQAALRLGPYNKNVPTTLVGLGAGGGGRRVLSAGNHGRSPLKVSEARRKPGISPVNSQGDRRASGPAALTQPGHGATATVRRHPPPQTLDVGDESDVEPTPGPAMGAGAGAGAGPSSYGHAALGQGPSRISQATYRGPPAAAAAAPMLAAGPSMRSQHPGGAQSGVLGPAIPGAARAGRREAVAGGGQPTAANPWGHSSGAMGSGEAAAANGSPRHRSLSAESYHAGSPGASNGGSSSRAPPPLSAAATARNAAAAAAAAAVTAKLNAASQAHPPIHHPPMPPQPPPGHLEPLNAPAGSRYGTSRAAGLPNDSGVGHSDRHPSSDQLGGLTEPQPPARSSSFSALSNPTPHPLADHLEPLGNPTSGPAGAGASVGFGGSPPPPLPGLLLTGRRSSSLRAEGGWSGWDPDGPAVQVPQATSTPHGASNVSLWISPTAAGAGAAAAGLQGGPAPCGRGSPILTGQPLTRREQVAGGGSGSSSRLQRGAPAGPGPAMGLGVGILDLSLGPERSAEKLGGGGGGQASVASVAAGRGATGRGQAGGALGHIAVQSTSRFASPDPARGFMVGPSGFKAPQQDALTEFCASRVELGSAGAASSGSSMGAGTAQEARGHSGGAGGPSMPLSVAMPMRVASVNKMPAAAARVS